VQGTPAAERLTMRAHTGHARPDSLVVRPPRLRPLLAAHLLLPLLRLEARVRRLFG